MPLNLSESELQTLVIDSLKAKTFTNSIKGIETLKAKLAQDGAGRFIPSFLVDFKLEQSYAKGALEVLSALSDYEIINGEQIRNVSLEVNTGGVRQLLYPDVVLYNPTTRQLVIIELKIAGNSEREAVTELAAFVQEVKNHLPFSSDLDVTLVVIAEDYKTLLNHAVSALAMDTRYNILCLMPELNTTGKLEFSIHSPHAAWTDIGQSYTDANTFLSKTILLKPKGGTLEDEHHAAVNMATDMLVHEAIKIGTHGFFLVCGNEEEEKRNLAVNINLLNPYVFLQFAIDNAMALNDTQPLAAYLKEKQLGSDKLQETVALGKLVKVIEDAVGDHFDVIVEETGTYHANMVLHSGFRQKYAPFGFDSWGAIGEYVRYLVRHTAFRKYYFREHDSLSALAYKEPYLGLQIVNLITGDYLLKKGGFNATDTYEFCRLFDFYVQRHMEKLKGEEPNADDDCTLVYTMVDLVMALKEFHIRILTAEEDEEMGEVPPVTLTVNKTDHDFLSEFKEFSNWHVNHFTNQSAIINKLLIKYCYDAAAYFNPRSFRYSSETKVEYEQEIAKFMKDTLVGYIVGAHIDKDQAVKSKADKIIAANYYPDFGEKNANEAMQAIMQMDDQQMLASWSSAFLEFADEVIDEVFHVLALDKAFFEHVDWIGIRERIVNRKRRGDTHLALTVDSAGNFGITNVGGQARTAFPDDIADYKEEIFFINGMAGMATVHKVKWEDVISGAFFDQLNEWLKK
jgi:hypothetical protein